MILYKIVTIPYPLQLVSCDLVTCSLLIDQRKKTLHQREGNND
jgi:hypothetical protein